MGALFQLRESNEGLVKIIAERSTKQIRGCLAIGDQASELINLAALAIQSAISTREIDLLACSLVDG